MLQDVISSTQSDLTLEELREKLTVQTETNSLVFGITITDDNPYEAADLANATAISFEEKIGDILDVNSVTILSQAAVNPNPISPNIPMNLVLGLLVGMMIGVGLAFLTEFMDKTVKDEKFIEELGWSNLGSVMQMTDKELVATRFVQVSSNQETRKSKRRV